MTEVSAPAYVHTPYIHVVSTYYQHVYYMRYMYVHSYVCTVLRMCVSVCCIVLQGEKEGASLERSVISHLL